tara:strand:+ start:455 stop:757 length:303 start_codon:yes stop_codon:yes gene_type:complete
MACKNVNTPIPGAGGTGSCTNPVAIKTIKTQIPQSLYLYKKRNTYVYKQTMGNCDASTKINGPGDSVTSVQKVNGRTYKGVDKKHGSYARYLAAKVNKCI